MLSVATGLLLANGLSLENLLVLSVLRLLEWVLYGFMGLIIIEAVFSWVNPAAPLAPFIRALTDPVMRPLRRIVPLIGSIDLSPLIALLLLQIALRVLTVVAMQLF
jgi:YggT family protein